MRHRVKGKKFHRLASRRRSFLRNLAANLIRRERLETTVIRAKAIRPAVEALITIGKKQSLAARRLLRRRLHNAAVVEKIMADLAPRYLKRHGGYTRIVKLARARKRDGAPVARIEFV